MPHIYIIIITQEKRKTKQKHVELSTDVEYHIQSEKECDSGAINKGQS